MVGAARHYPTREFTQSLPGLDDELYNQFTLDRDLFEDDLEAFERVAVKKADRQRKAAASSRASESGSSAIVTANQAGPSSQCQSL